MLGQSWYYGLPGYQLFVHATLYHLDSDWALSAQIKPHYFPEAIRD